MTVIAWDGKSIAADRQGTSGGIAATVSKIRKLKNGEVLTGYGYLSEVFALMRWYEAGAVKEDWPSFQTKEDWSGLIIMSPEGKITYYEYTPHPHTLKEKIYAWGGGAELALGALAAGASAKEAVLIASKYQIGCGKGVDVHHSKRNRKADLEELKVKINGTPKLPKEVAKQLVEKARPAKDQKAAAPRKLRHHKVSRL